MAQKKIGVFVCHCGINIASVVQIEELVKHGLPRRQILALRLSIFNEEWSDDWEQLRKAA